MSRISSSPDLKLANEISPPGVHVQFSERKEGSAVCCLTGKGGDYLQVPHLLTRREQSKVTVEALVHTVPNWDSAQSKTSTTPLKSLPPSLTNSSTHRDTNNKTNACHTQTQIKNKTKRVWGVEWVGVWRQVHPLPLPYHPHISTHCTH